MLQGKMAPFRCVAVGCVEAADGGEACHQGAQLNEIDLAGALTMVSR